MTSGGTREGAGAPHKEVKVVPLTVAVYPKTREQFRALVKKLETTQRELLERMIDEHNNDK